jgi:hypothetical protein
MISLKSFYVSVFASVILSCGNVTEVLKSVEEVMNENTVPTELEMGQGLKAALVKGTEMGVNSLSQSGGYLDSPRFKIPFPKDAQKVENALRKIGLDEQVDQMVVSLNRAAENAVTEAKPLFVDAIKEMTFEEVKKILFGADTAATAYLKGKTSQGLRAAFEPKIKNSLDQVNATKYWEDLITTYNKIPLVNKMNPDLSGFVTDQAIKGLFLKIADEEMAIRENPLERTSSILKKVFNYADQNQ